MVHRNINVAARYHEFVISLIMMRLPDKPADPIAGPLPVALPSVPGVQKIGKPIVCDARHRPDHRQADQPPQPDVPRRPQPNRDRAIDPRIEPVLAIDGIKPAPDIVDPEAEAYERVRLEIDVAKSIAPVRAARTRRLCCQSMPALQTGHLVLYQTVSFWVITPLHLEPSAARPRAARRPPSAREPAPHYGRVRRCRACCRRHPAHARAAALRP